MELPRSSAPRSNGWFMDVALEVYRGRTIVQRDALIQQSLTTGSHACPACIVGLSHMEFSMRCTARTLLVSRDISTSRPCERRDPYGEESRFGTGAEAFLLLRPGVMDPCVRRDDSLRTRA